ncbi:sodium-dependent organic anion transporter-like isoform X2 [Danaus plexippus]|nr:sodium-dependent organic anion transporter-like isoform X2 [Danaus plexippus]XP_032523380.2 sodium-dependent organic anion transporter-like isoform X2 [Danaus plexippus]XP_061380013.1 sodium-dependent organic anion transporter-like isoform X2 [Danaus plexippus]
MCPLWPLHLIVLYLLVLGPMWVLCQAAPNLMATYLPTEVEEVHMGDTYYVDVNVTGVGLRPGARLQVNVRDEHVADTKWNSSYQITENDVSEGKFKGRLRIIGNFLGRTILSLESHGVGDTIEPVNGTLAVTVTRPQRVIDTIFTTSIAIFISIVFINFGCAMHWDEVKGVVRRPVGPIIGLCGQFVFMPLISFGLGYLIFPSSPSLHLGMFCTGVAPGGGASNIWTFILGGNLDLSLTMTSISTLAAFGFMPLWLFTLGQVVFANASIVVPYSRIAMFVVGLIVPLIIGLAMQKFTPRLSAFMVRILKPFSSCILIFIIVFAIVTNLYIFELFSWQILLAGMGIPWLGYISGYLVAWLFRQPHPDALAISIETGIQNTGIAIFLLRYALPQPEADITTVVPVACAIMTPIPMTAIFIYQKLSSCGICPTSKTEHNRRKMSTALRPSSPASNLPLMENKEGNWSSSSA